MTYATFDFFIKSINTDMELMEEDNATHSDSKATFRYTVQNFSKLEKSVFSPTFSVRNLTWKMEVKPPLNSENGSTPPCLGVYLYCKNEKNSSYYRSWSCNAFVELRLLSVLPDVMTFSRSFQRLWKSKPTKKSKSKDNNSWVSWGFANFKAWNDVLDPKGFIKDDAITLEVHVVLLETFLIEAIQRNSLEDIKSLSIDRTFINTVDDEGNTPLHYAIKSGNTEIVEYLIESKANVYNAGEWGQNKPLVTAVKTGNIDIIQLLLRHGAGDTSIQSAFFTALTWQNLAIVKLLIQHGALLNINFTDGHTALTKSVEIENLDIIKVLIHHGADINMPKKDGSSPLSLALKTGNSQICNYLINNNGKLIASDSDQAFEYLIKYIEDDNFDMVKILVELGAELDETYKGETPLIKAIQVENFEMVEYLIKKGANVNERNDEGELPLEIAADNRDILIVKLLIQSKANLYLVKGEMEELACHDEDFGVYWKMLKKSRCICGYDTKMNASGDFHQEAAPRDE